MMVLFLSVVIILLIIVVILSVKKVYALFRMVEEIRLNPLESKWQKLDSTVSTSVFVYGDSHAEFWYNFPIENHLNYGVCGQTTAQLVLRSKDIYPFIDADYMLLSAGGNDVKAIATLPQKRQIILQKAFENLQHLINNAPAKKIILMIPPRIFNIPLRYYLADIKAGETSQLQWNEKLRALASDKVIVFDLYEAFEQLSNRKSYSDDGIHFNEKGYQFISEKLTELLEKENQAKAI